MQILEGNLFSKRTCYDEEVTLGRTEGSIDPRKINSCLLVRSLFTLVLSSYKNEHTSLKLSSQQL